jgi:hypothetical protein
MTEPLSDAQKKSIDDGYCPDCGHRGFVLGPKGGAMLNIECGELVCRARFNVLIDYMGGPRMISERIPREIDGGTDWGKPLTDRRRYPPFLGR